MYELCPYITNDGSVGLFSKDDNDIYHSTHGALTESWQKFILPCKLEDYLTLHGEVKILDICYGIGYNTKTALNVFITYALKNEKKNKKNEPLPTNNSAIYTDNILDASNDKRPSSLVDFDKNNKSNSLNKNTSTNNVSIYADNTRNVEYRGANDKSETFYDAKSFNSVAQGNKILIDAVDLDATLMNLSPFINRGKKNNFLSRKYLSKKYFQDDNSKSKLHQIKKINKTKIMSFPKKIKLRKEVSMIILKKLLEQNSELANDEILQTLLNQKKYTPFFDKYMLHFAKFYSNSGCNYDVKRNLSAFLHNIYYGYISSSYKNMQKLLNTNNIELNFYNNDARSFVKETSNKYNFIFLDAFTPSKCPALWTVQFFEQLYSKLEDDGMILTYSSSAAIRNAFLENGFFVGKTYDSKSKKFIGTIAAKNQNLIDYKLDNKDFDLIKSKAGICFKDENLELDNATILENRENEIMSSDLLSSTSVLKGYKDGNIKSL